jgi:hypothetical protein
LCFEDAVPGTGRAEIVTEPSSVKLMAFSMMFCRIFSNLPASVRMTGSG